MSQRPDGVRGARRAYQRARFHAALTAAGATVQPGPERPPSIIFDAPSRELWVNGSAHLSVFEYPTTAAAKAEAEGFHGGDKQCPGERGGSIIDYAAPPHLYWRARSWSSLSVPLQPRANCWRAAWPAGGRGTLGLNVCSMEIGPALDTPSACISGLEWVLIGERVNKEPVAQAQCSLTVPTAQPHVERRTGVWHGVETIDRQEDNF